MKKKKNLELRQYILENWKGMLLEVAFSLGLLLFLSYFVQGAFFYAAPAILAVYALNPVQSLRKFSGNMHVCVLYEFFVLLPSFMYMLYKLPPVLWYGPYLALPVILITNAYLGRILSFVPKALMVVPLGVMVLFGGMISLDFFPSVLQWVAAFNPTYFATQSLFDSLNGLGLMKFNAAFFRQILLLVFYFVLSLFLTRWKNQK